MDENTPPVKEAMNKTFNSKVTITATYKEEVELENEIVTTVVSKNEETSNEKEDFSINAKSEKYDVTEYSKDGVNFYPIDNPSKDVTINISITDEGRHVIYIKDEVGNIKEVEVLTEKLDQTGPSIEIESDNKKETIDLTINFSDEKSGLSGYKITESSTEPDQWEDFDILSQTLYTKTVNFTVSKNTTYYIWVKDKAGNVNYKAYSSTTIDTKAPDLEVEDTLSDAGGSAIISISARDDVIGLSGVSVTKVEGEYHWEPIEGTPLEYSKTVEVLEDGTYYISVKDAYDHITTKRIVINYIDIEAPQNSFSTGSSTEGSNNWYKDLSIKVNLSDNSSGVKSAKYCVTTSDSCTPDIDATISNDSYTVTLESNVNAQKICSRATDNKGNTSEVLCSDAYKVDTIDPSQSFSIESSTSGENGWYKELTIGVEVSDDHSGVASAKYCVATGDTCTPESNATLENNKFSVSFETSNLAQKACVQVIDNAGRGENVACSIAYKVDMDSPIAKIIASQKDGSVTLSAKDSSDSGSGIKNYYYSKDGGNSWQSSESSTYTFTGLPQSNHTFAIKVEDNAGYTSSMVGANYYPNSLYNVIAKQATLDNTKSEFVTSDESLLNDKSIMSYVVLNEDKSTYTAFLQSQGSIYLNPNSSYLFYGFSKLESIEGIEYLDSSKVTNMSAMFWRCYSLTNLDLSNFDTSNVTNMSSMFSRCNSLMELDVSGFNTNKVTDMFWLFSSCSS